MMPERHIELELGWQPELAVPGPVIMAADEQMIFSCNAYVSSREGEWRAIVRVPSLLQLRFGSPPGEELNHGFAEVQSSSWLQHLIRERPHLSTLPLRHFAFAFHDSSLEFLAPEFESELRKIDLEKPGSILEEMLAWVNQFH